MIEIVQVVPAQKVSWTDDVAYPPRAEDGNVLGGLVRRPANLIEVPAVRPHRGRERCCARPRTGCWRTDRCRKGRGGRCRPLRLFPRRHLSRSPRRRHRPRRFRRRRHARAVPPGTGTTLRAPPAAGSGPPTGAGRSTPAPPTSAAGAARGRMTAVSRCAPRPSRAAGPHRADRATRRGAPAGSRAAARGYGATGRGVAARARHPSRPHAPPRRRRAACPGDG